MKLKYSWSTDQHPAYEPTEVAMLSKNMPATLITQNKMTWQYSHDKYVPITKQILATKLEATLLQYYKLYKLYAHVKHFLQTNGRC